MVIGKRMMMWMGAGLLVPSLSHALSVGRLEVQSTLGEPFRAELVVSDLNGIAAADVQASLASESDFSQLGVPMTGYSGALNISTRAAGVDRVVVKIQSRQPLNDPFLDVVIKIKAGQNTRLQHLTALIDPPQRPTPDSLPLLADGAGSRAPIELSNSTAAHVTVPKNNEKPLIPLASEPPPLAPAPVAPPPPLMTEAERATAPKYVVQKNDSLWKIATRLQGSLNKPAGQIMTQIRQLNEKAFVRGNPDQLKSGAELVLPKPEKPQQDLVAQRVTPPPAPPQKPVTAKPVAPPSTPLLPRSGRLPRAEMTLIAPTSTGIAQGNSMTTGRRTGVQPLSRDLATRVGQARQKTVALRREVLELDAQVAVNDQKIALQNAKLAELEQRLKARKDAKRRAQAQSTVPVIALTLAALFGSALLGVQPVYAATEQAIMLEDLAV
jgi:pilus assembly protein FimV